MQTWHLDDDVSPVEVASYSVDATQSCPAQDAQFCDYFFLFKRDFVDHDRYALAITFPDPAEYLAGVEEGADHDDLLYDVESRVISVNPEFTRFEIAFKYIWFVATLLVMFCPFGVGFMSAVARQRRDTGVGKTFHQKWTAVLLWALVWFDDPFVAATVYTDWAKFFSAVFILSASVFVFLMLLFWLCFLTDVRVTRTADRRAHRGLFYWVPKVRDLFSMFDRYECCHGAFHFFESTRELRHCPSTLTARTTVTKLFKRLLTLL